MIAKHEDETMLVTRIIEDPTPDDSVLEKDNDKQSECKRQPTGAFVHHSPLQHLS